MRLRICSGFFSPHHKTAAIMRVTGWLCARANSVTGLTKARLVSMLILLVFIGFCRLFDWVIARHFAKVAQQIVYLPRGLFDGFRWISECARSDSSDADRADFHSCGSQRRTLGQDSRPKRLKWITAAAVPVRVLDKSSQADRRDSYSHGPELRVPGQLPTPIGVKRVHTS